MRVDAIVGFLDTITPFELAEPWDNSGLIVGSLQDEVSSIYLSIDLDESLALEVAPNSLIITHHPLIMKGIKTLDTGKFPANIIKILMQKNVSVVALHTNFDKTHLNKFVAQNILGLEIACEEGFVCICETQRSFDELLQDICTKLELKHTRFVKAKEDIKKIAIVTGSGMDLLDSIECDLFLTGDIKYHQAFMAKANGISLIDIGHFESERYFAQIIAEDLKKIEIQAIISNSKNPFDFYTSD